MQLKCSEKNAVKRDGFKLRRFDLLWAKDRGSLNSHFPENFLSVYLKGLVVSCMQDIQGMVVRVNN